MTDNGEADWLLDATRTTSSIASGRSKFDAPMSESGRHEPRDISTPRRAKRFSDGQSGRWRMIMEMPETEHPATKRQVWNAGKTVGAKRALKPKQIWEIRFYPNQHRRLRDRALFDLAIDSKLRGCDLVRMKIGDVVSGGQVRRAQS